MIMSILIIAFKLLAVISQIATICVAIKEFRRKS